MKIKLGKATKLPKDGKQFQTTIKKYIVDEWLEMGFEEVNVFRDGLRIIIEPPSNGANETIEQELVRLRNKRLEAKK